MNLGAAGPGWLFCPADRPERFAKAAVAADVVILDLEDGVAEADKPAARKALQDTPLDPERTVAVMWGAEDLVATLGGSSSRTAEGTYRDVARHVRSTALLAASAFGR